MSECHLCVPGVLICGKHVAERLAERHQSELETLRAEVARYREALEAAQYDFSRILTADWDAHQMRLCAKGGEFRAREALKGDAT